MRGAPEEKKPQKMVRSSIACSRCRRSKVKCVNTGVLSPCKACLQSNRECSYPTAGSSTPAPKRSEAPAGIKLEGDTGESKKRIRKIEDTGRRNSQKPGEDVLESPLLTRKVWDELYELFKLHFSTEMPFLHPPTFRNRMRQAAYPRDASISVADIEDGKVLLLGVLTLTARFHPVLVAHHSPHQDNPLAASEYYATALAAALGPTIRTISKPSLANIQALLMIGLYDWGQTRGLSAWLYVGLAIRLAFPMGLAIEDDSDKLPSQGARKSPTPREDAIEKEVRRRTLWSCFVMDRMLSAGKERPTMINTDMLRVQLPCSDDQFLFVHDVKTAFLKSSCENTTDQMDISNNDEGVLSRYIRLVDIFGRLSTWSYAGGRRAPGQLPPWEPESDFDKLWEELKQFHRALPPSLTFTDANLSAHIEKRNATTYASMHTLYYLCLIVLHREYIPFVAVQLLCPAGPLDPPTFPPEKFDIPDGYWERSANTLMEAAHTIIQIVKTCRENSALPESPMVGFAIWQAAFVCLYVGWFPKMDTRNLLVEMTSVPPPDFDAGYIGETRRILKEILPRLKMVKQYLDQMDRMHHFYYNVTVLHVKTVKLSGGGLELYKKFEKDLKEFGDLRDPDIPPSEASDPEQMRSRASTNEIHGSTNGDPMPGVELGISNWAAVNKNQPAKASSPPVEELKSYPSPHPFGMPVHSPNQSSNAPSLMSASNGDTTPGVNSPFVSSQVSYPASQPHHASAFPSISSHTMAQSGHFADDGRPPMTEIEWLERCNNINMPGGLDGLMQDPSIASQWDQNALNQANFFQTGIWGPPGFYSKEQQALGLGMQ